MPALDRQQQAQVFRQKADEALASGKKDLEDRFYRSACDRAWYAIYHSISAAVLAKLQQQIPNKGNWDHDDMPGLLHHFLRNERIRIRKGYLIELIESVLKSRVAADYGSDETLASADDARSSIVIAERVRNTIWEALQWQQQS